MKAHAVRLPPGEDLAIALSRLVVERKLEAAAVVTCVGSLEVASIRFANEPHARVLAGPFEIVSLVGTLEPTGQHLHICLSDNVMPKLGGRCVGGHVKEGCLVHTTAEVVLAELPSVRFSRLHDPRSGYPELVTESR